MDQVEFVSLPPLTAGEETVMQVALEDSEGRRWKAAFEPAADRLLWLSGPGEFESDPEHPSWERAASVISSALGTIVDGTTPEDFERNAAVYERRGDLSSAGLMRSMASKMRDMQHMVAKTLDAETVNKGIMVAVPIPTEVAKRLEVPDGEPHDRMHVTLAFIGKLGEDGIPDNADGVMAALRRVVEPALAAHSSMKGQVGGTGTFVKGEDGVPAWAALDCPGLNELRADIFRALVAGNVPVKTDHGFAPHITVAYLEDGDDHPLKIKEAIPVEITEVLCSVGTKNERIALGSAGQPQWGQNQAAQAVIAPGPAIPMPAPQVASPQAQRPVAAAVPTPSPPRPAPVSSAASAGMRPGIGKNQGPPDRSYVGGTAKTVTPVRGAGYLPDLSNVGYVAGLGGQYGPPEGFRPVGRTLGDGETRGFDPSDDQIASFVRQASDEQLQQFAMQQGVQQPAPEPVFHVVAGARVAMDAGPNGEQLIGSVIEVKPADGYYPDRAMIRFAGEDEDTEVPLRDLHRPRDTVAR
jgi:2'-5' RNA ligase